MGKSRTPRDQKGMGERGFRLTPVEEASSGNLLVDEQAALSGRKRKPRAEDSPAEMGPVPRKRTRSQITITDDELRLAQEALAELERPHGGGIGVPGGRKAEDVKDFKGLDLRNPNPSLREILETSTQIHQSNFTIEQRREVAAQTNVRVDYPENSFGVFSLHVANDIVAVWNSKKQGKSTIHTYKDLAKALDIKFTSQSNKYFTKQQDYRYETVIAGVRSLLSGKPDEAINSFTEKAGATDKGLKWIYKFTNLMMAERAREVVGGRTGLVTKALDSVSTVKSFKIVFASSRTSELAPFALRRGAETYRESGHSPEPFPS